MTNDDTFSFVCQKLFFFYTFLQLNKLLRKIISYLKTLCAIPNLLDDFHVMFAFISEK